MIRLLAAWTRIAVVAVSMAMSIPAITFAQTPESATESEPTAGDNASPVQAASGPEDNTSVETNPPARSAIPSEVEAENQRLINELRSELLDDRADYIDRWLSVIGVVLTFFGIVVAIVGVWGFRKFQKIETEAKNILGEIKKNRDKSLDILQKLNAEAAAKNPAQAHQAVKNTRENPKASLTDKAIANALDLQQQGRNKEAIKKWRGLARVAEGSDNDLAARAWLSVGYLALDDGDLKGSLLAYDEAIRLNPALVEAYGNRGYAKQQLEQYEDALADYAEAIRLKPDYAEAYNNRGAVKDALGRYDDALADYAEAIRLKPDHARPYYNLGIVKAKLGRDDDALADYAEAIRLKPDHAGAFYNRGVAKAKLGRYEDALADYAEAIRLKPDYAEAYNNRGAVKAKLGRDDDALADYAEAIRLKPDLAEAYGNRGNVKNALGLKDEARKDFETTLELARNANNAGVVAQAEQSLRDLNAAGGS